MNRLSTKLIAIVLLLSTAVSSLAVESTTTRSAIPVPVPLTAPLMLAKKTALNPADLAKYQHLAVQSQGLTMQQVAGASSTTKTVLITVGVIVVVVVVAGAISFHDSGPFLGPDFHF